MSLTVFALTIIIALLVTILAIIIRAKMSVEHQISNQQAIIQEGLLDAALEHSNSTQRVLIESANANQNILNQSLSNLTNTLQTTLHHTRDALEKRFEQLSQSTDQRLVRISEKVESRLAEGFEKTNATFTDIVKRLALIDDAQKKITALSENVVSLQEILSDKRSRGAFGEVQLNSLVSNMLAPESYSLQHTLSNGFRVDLLLKLPEPTGHVAVDSKFPLENYRLMNDTSLASSDQSQARSKFKQDIKKHIKDIQEKYICPGDTGDGAVMFIPAEAVFAEIHANFSDCVEFANQSRVWITSPTTMMAILTTARAVIKDSATRQQVHLIQEHLRYLAEDFQRFEKRMQNLARHIQQANTDVGDIQISATKITKRFERIESVELDSLESDPSEEEALADSRE